MFVIKYWTKLGITRDSNFFFLCPSIYYLLGRRRIHAWFSKTVHSQGCAVLTLQSHFKLLRPLPCKGLEPSKMSQCEPADSSQRAILFAGIYLVALGIGGGESGSDISGSWSIPWEGSKGGSFPFELLQLVLVLLYDRILAVTFLVWINTNQGWDWSFGIC